MVAAVSTFGLDFFANLAPGVDHGPCIAAFIDVPSVIRAALSLLIYLSCFLFRSVIDDE
jgi:hypothetical protein